MPLRITFNLGEADLQHFEAVAQQTQANARQLPAETIIAAARDILQSAEGNQTAAFVRERFARLQAVIEMATDADWLLSEEDRRRVLNALACFSGPPAAASPFSAGLLDHAIMIELVSRDLEHDLDAYRDFCDFRKSEFTNRRRPGVEQDLQRDEWLQQRRAVLQSRMHARRKRALEAAGSSVRRLFSLFGL
ncbi:MAG TPA: hypothetical protein VGN07_21075 [Steroidobacteraceae bacterium]|jgi:hypothetical protein